jgi:hypothetical protein
MAIAGADAFIDPGYVATYQSAASVFVSGAQAIGAGALTTVNFHSGENFDLGGNFTAQRFVAPQSRQFFLMSTITVTPDIGAWVLNDYVYIIFALNAGLTEIRRSTYVFSGAVTVEQTLPPIFRLLSLTAGDYIQVRAYSNVAFTVVGGGGLPNDGKSTFEAFMVR